MSLYIYRVTFESGEVVTGTGKSITEAIYSAVAVRNTQEYAIAKEKGEDSVFRAVNASSIISCERVKRYHRSAVCA